jgi:hypothetical protein
MQLTAGSAEIERSVKVWNFLEETMRNLTLQIEVRIGYLPNASEKGYCCVNLLNAKRDIAFMEENNYESIHESD